MSRSGPLGPLRSRVAGFARRLGVARQAEGEAFLTSGRWQAYAHRGDRSGRPPGNRWSSYASAVEAGYDHIETDVHLSADGVLVTFHDEVLDDETTGAGRIADHDWAHLQTLRYRTDGGVADEGLVRFADALEHWPTLRWNVDAKQPETVGPLLELLDVAGATDRVLVTSFDWRTVTRLRRRAAPETCTGLSMVEIAAARLAVWLRLPLPPLADAAQVPARHGRITVVDEAFVRACHRARMAVHVWTIDDPAEVRRLFDLGVDAIMTDEPTAPRDVLRERGRW